MYNKKLNNKAHVKNLNMIFTVHSDVYLKVIIIIIFPYSISYNFLPEIYFHISDTEIIALCRHIVVAIMFYLIHATSNFLTAFQRSRILLSFNPSSNTYLQVNFLNFLQLLFLKHPYIPLIYMIVGLLDL